MNSTVRSAWPISVGVASILGGRQQNHDRVFADARTLLVVDGVGGQSNAGAIATAGLAGALHGIARADTADGDAVDIVRAAVAGAAELAGGPGAGAGGAATITLARVTAEPAPAVQLAWLGDSPAFLLRDGALQQLTRAHNRAQELAEQRLLTFEEASASPLAGVLTRGIGALTGEPETVSLPLQEGDRLVVASDGLLALPLASIGRALRRGADARAAADALIAAAIARGAGDNVAVAVLVVGGDPRAASAWLPAGAGSARPAVRQLPDAAAGDAAAGDITGARAAAAVAGAASHAAAAAHVGGVAGAVDGGVAGAVDGGAVAEAADAGGTGNGGQDDREGGADASGEAGTAAADTAVGDDATADPPADDAAADTAAGAEAAAGEARRPSSWWRPRRRERTTGVTTQTTAPLPDH